MEDNTTTLEVVMQYHEETKHHFDRYARALDRLDWANQPDPFRRYAGAALKRLPILKADEAPLSPSYPKLYCSGAVASAPVTVRALSRLFEYALALSAWKQAGGTRWALRSNPSSGNLHPTEGYLLIGEIPDLAPSPGLFHYAPREHGLERRADCTADLFGDLMREFPPQAFLVGLSSVHWREAWKYGERAFRYCQHDVGHAIGSIRIAAATLGWSALMLHGLADETVECLLGLDRSDDFADAEREHPDLVIAVWPGDPATDGRAGEALALPMSLDPTLVRKLAQQPWYGKANRLSPEDPVPWEIIDRVAAASRKSTGETHRLDFIRSCQGSGTVPLAADAPSAGRIIRQRRSLLSCDGKTAICAANFYAMLGRVMPHLELAVTRRPMPWDAIPWDSTIHLGLFVHRVNGLDPGLYVLARDPAKVDKLRRSMREQFVWAAPPGCPPDLPLYLLELGDAKRLAAQLSCHQDVAGDGAFSLGMIAEYRQLLVTQGPWFYRRLFWESGVIGQVLYLEAEALGVRATGIGCFFDDPVHQTFGFKDFEFQSLYHFTVGGAVDDPRLTTLPPYGARVAGRERGMDLP
ncbi:MAG: SagB/ThcOx family dehydrogenase [Burkholderiales bacterium]